jgi:hypothetical protein
VKLILQVQVVGDASTVTHPIVVIGCYSALIFNS